MSSSYNFVSDQNIARDSLMNEMLDLENRTPEVVTPKKTSQKLSSNNEQTPVDIEKLVREILKETDEFCLQHFDLKNKRHVDDLVGEPGGKNNCFNECALKHIISTVARSKNGLRMTTPLNPDTLPQLQSPPSNQKTSITDRSPITPSLKIPASPSSPQSPVVNELQVSKQSTESTGYADIVFTLPQGENVLLELKFWNPKWIKLHNDSTDFDISRGTNGRNNPSGEVMRRVIQDLEMLSLQDLLQCLCKAPGSGKNNPSFDSIEKLVTEGLKQTLEYKLLQGEVKSRYFIALIGRKLYYTAVTEDTKPSELISVDTIQTELIEEAPIDHTTSVHTSIAHLIHNTIIDVGLLQDSEEKEGYIDVLLGEMDVFYRSFTLYKEIYDRLHETKLMWDEFGDKEALLDSLKDATCQFKKEYAKLFDDSHYTDSQESVISSFDQLKVSQ